MIIEVKVPIANAKAGKAATLKLDTVADRVTLAFPFNHEGSGDRAR